MPVHPAPISPRVTGLVLAAGQGSRMGRPKALMNLGEVGFVEATVETLVHGGCRDVLVVLGAQAGAVATQLEPALDGWGERVATVDCGQWRTGLSASLHTGLAALAARGRRCPLAAMVHLVDLPDVGPEVVGRVLDIGRSGSTLPSSLARATYRGQPGHPVLVGRDHWQGVLESARGDQGAGPYLRAHHAVTVECGDLATGHDVDTPEALAAYLRRAPGPHDDPRDT